MNDIAVWAMLATPFTEGGAHVDHASLHRYCEVVTDRGCSAVVVLGVIGEPNALSRLEQLAVIETALASGAEVHVGSMADTAEARFADVAAVAERFGEGVAGYLIPVGTSSPEALRAEIADLHSIGGRSIVLQDYPASTGVSIAVEDLAHAVRDLPSVTAIKCEAPPTFARIRRLRELAPEVRLMSGLGGSSLVDDLTQGARLVASGTSRPEIAVQAVRAWLAGDDARARKIVASAAAAVGFETQQGTSIAIRKEHWRRQGVIASSAVRPPAHPYETWLASLSDGHGFLDPDRSTTPATSC